MLSQRQTTASKAFLDPSCLTPEIRRCSCVYRDISRRLPGRAHIQIQEVRNSKSRGNSLLAKGGVSIPAGNTIEKANRDERYAFLLASMQNNSGPKPAVKSAKLA